MKSEAMRNQVNVLVNGWYGAGNIGDELLLRLFAQWCEEAGAQVRVMSARPTHTREIHHLESLDSSDFPTVARAMAETDLLVLGGGGLFQTHYAFTPPSLYSFAQGDVASYARPILMARQMGIPSLLWAQGVGPLVGSQARSMVRDLFDGAHSLSVRDDCSRELLHEIGVRREVLVAPDPVWALPIGARASAAARPTGKRRLGLVVRPWDFVEGWEGTLAHALREVVDPAEWTLVWLPFQAGDAEGRFASDLPLIERLRSALEGYTHDVAALVDPGDAAIKLDECDRLVCMRLHAQILGYKLGKPVLAVEYDPKMSHASAMAGIPPEARLAPSAAASEWHNALQWLLSAQAPVAGDSSVRDLAKRALQHRGLLHSVIADVRTRREDAQWQEGHFDWIGTWSADWLHRMLADRDGRLAMLGRVLRERDAVVERQAGDLARERAATDAAKAEARAAQDQLFQARDEVLRMQNALVVAQESLCEKDVEIDAFRRRLDDWQQEYKLLHEREQALTSTLESSSARIESLSHDIQHHASIARGLRDELCAVRSSLDSVSQANVLLEHELKGRRDELAQVRGSWSWRLTYPIRFCRALMVLRGEERRQLARAGLRTVFWSLPEPLRLRIAKARGRAYGRRLRASPPPPPRIHAPAEWVLLADRAPRVAIVPSAFEFDEVANQRPINLAKFLARRGYLVIFAAWQWSRGEQLQKSNRMVHPGVWQIDLYDLVDNVGALASRRDADSGYFITLPAPDLVRLHPVLRSKGLAVAYDILDDWEAFHEVGQAPWFSHDYEHEAVLAADVVCAVSPPLALKFSHLRSDIHVVGNGYNAATLGVEHRFCAAEREVAVEPRIGYFGHLTDAWFDWDTVLAAARRMPHFRFEIIGYGEPEWVRQAAAELPNLQLVGKVPPSSLWEYARHWTVGLAPFKPGKLAVAIDPIKVYEYLYLGVPTVCTGIPHLSALPGVRVAEGVDEFVRYCALAAEVPLDYHAVEQCLEHTTWDARFECMLGLLLDPGLRSLYAST